MKAAVLVVFIISSFGTYASAQSKNEGKGQAAFVVNESAPLYKNAAGDDLISGMSKDDAVAGITTLGKMVQSYQFEDESGRVHVFTLTSSGRAIQGWMNRADLSPYFTYECGCGLSNAKCSPHVLERLHYKWNICFEEAVQAKRADGEKGAVAPAATAPKESAEERLKALSELYKKGLITKEEYDTKRAEILKTM